MSIQDKTKPGNDLDNRVVRRAVAYVVLFFVLVCCYILIERLHWYWQEGNQLHVILEVISIVLGFLIGTIALVRFYTDKTGIFLFVGSGFLGSSFLDSYHSILSAGFISDSFISSSSSLIPWSWMAPRLYLSVYLFISSLIALQKLSVIRNTRCVKMVYTESILLTIGGVLLFSLVPSHIAHYPDLIVTRPEEFLPALFFLLALYVYLKVGFWRKDPFHHWMIISLIVSSSTQILFISHSAELFDLEYHLAHLAKGMSYLCVFFGLLLSIHKAYSKLTAKTSLLHASIDALHNETNERKQIEKELRESERNSRENEERLRAIVETAADGIITIDEFGIVDTMNKAAERIFGYSAKEIIGKNVSLLMPSPTREAHDGYLRRRLSNKPKSLVDFSHEVIGQRKNGSRFPMTLGLSEMFVNDRRYYTGLVRDNSLEKQYQEERDRQISIIETNPDLIATIDLQGNILFLNQGGRKILGFQSDENLHDRNLSSLIPQSEIEKLLNDEAREDIPLKTRRGESMLITAEGTIMTVSQQLVLHECDSNKQAYISISMRDISERKEAEEQLQKHRDHLEELVAEQTRELRFSKEAAEAANQAKSAFLANMSHELRTPMHAILSFADFGRNKCANASTEKLVQYFSRIHQSGKRLLNLLNDLLDLSKLEAGKMSYDFQRGDIKELVELVLSEQEAWIKQQKLRVQVIVPNCSTQLSLDQNKIIQVLRNLISNAIKFSVEGGRIIISFTASQLPTGRRSSDKGAVPAVTVIVRDEGVGIPKDELAVVFDAFVQSTKTKTGAGGTGLGLAISREIIGAHGGVIWAENHSQGGAVFSFTLPICPPALALSEQEKVT